MEVVVGGIYKHFKGDHYLVEGIATHSETGEQMVVYRALYGAGQLYVRPHAMFTEQVNRGGQKHRFELLDVASVVRS